MPKAEEGENPLPPAEEVLVQNLFSVKDKVCLVTGGGSGIGAMIAAGYVGNGAKVYIISRKDTSDFAKILTERGPGKCIALRGDLAKEKDIDALVAELEKRESKGVNVLVNNAGTNWSAPIDKYDVAAWDKVYDVNVRSVFALTRKMTPLLEKAGTKEDPSRVLNISSIDGERVPAQPTFAYSSGKAAVTRLSMVLAAWLADKNITVNAILPGAFASRMMRGTLETFGDHIKATTPMGRIGDMKDMAGLCIFLSSRAGAWMTGGKIVIDGGALLVSSGIAKL